MNTTFYLICKYTSKISKEYFDIVNIINHNGRLYGQKISKE